MSFRHTFITQFTYFISEEPEDIHELISVLTSHVDQINPVYSVYGELKYIAMQSRDHDNYSTELNEMPALLKGAAGILKSDLDIVAAWEAENDPPRQRVFTIKGRGQITRLEYIEKGNA